MSYLGKKVTDGKDNLSSSGEGNSLAYGAWLHFEARTSYMDLGSFFDSSDPKFCSSLIPFLGHLVRK